LSKLRKGVEGSWIRDPKWRMLAKGSLCTSDVEEIKKRIVKRDV